MDEEQGNAGVVVGAQPGKAGGFGVFVRIKEAHQTESFRPLPGEENRKRGGEVGDEGISVAADFDGVFVERIVEGDLALVAFEGDHGGNAVVSGRLAESFARVLFGSAADRDKGSAKAVAAGFVFEVFACHFDLVGGEKLKDGGMPAGAGNVLMGDGEAADFERSIPWVEIMGPDQGKDAVEGIIVGAAHFRVGGSAVELGGQFLKGTKIQFPC
jgi:hypothetical protein